MNYPFDQMRRNLIANVSHELRTPLTVIHGYLEVILHKPDAALAHCRPMLEEIHAHSQRMQRLVADLLLLSQLESDDTPVDARFEAVSVVAMVNDMIQSARALCHDKQHQFSLNIDRTLTLRGVQSELYSAFSNLVFNAVHYTPSGGRITLTWSSSTLPGKRCFSVEDTGIGIEKGHLPHLTQRFYRVDKARSRQSGGTGLGLAIVKHVLIRHGGELAISSTLGQGSCFRCVFPSTATTA